MVFKSELGKPSTPLPKPKDTFGTIDTIVEKDLHLLEHLLGRMETFNGQTLGNNAQRIYEEYLPRLKGNYTFEALKPYHLRYVKYAVDLEKEDKEDEYDEY